VGSWSRCGDCLGVELICAVERSGGSWSRAELGARCDEEKGCEYTFVLTLNTYTHLHNDEKQSTGIGKGE
jgi:hypothetical protein